MVAVPEFRQVEASSPSRLALYNTAHSQSHNFRFQSGFPSGFPLPVNLLPALQPGFKFLATAINSLPGSQSWSCFLPPTHQTSPASAGIDQPSGFSSPATRSTISITRQQLPKLYHAFKVRVAIFTFSSLLLLGTLPTSIATRFRELPTLVARRCSWQFLPSSSHSSQNTTQSIVKVSTHARYHPKSQSDPSPHRVISKQGRLANTRILPPTHLPEEFLWPRRIYTAHTLQA